MRYLVNGEEIELEPSGAQVEILPDRLVVRSGDSTDSALSVRSGDQVLVSYRGRVFRVEKPSARAKRSQGKASGETHAPMPGQVVEVFVEQGSRVASGQKLLVLEAMKMQHTVSAPFEGTVTALPVSKGEQVAEGQLLVSVEPEHEQPV